MDINGEIEVALFGAVYEGDPLGGDSTPIPETMYPTLDSFSQVMGMPVDLLYKDLVRQGVVRILTKEGWVFITHAYTHDNNTTRTLQ